MNDQEELVREQDGLICRAPGGDLRVPPLLDAFICRIDFINSTPLNVWGVNFVNSFIKFLSGS